MPRIKEQEIIRRTAVAQRESNAPDLQVNADMDSARGVNGLSSVASNTLSALSSAFSDDLARRKVKKNEEEETAGAAQRTKEDLAGTPRQEGDALAAMTDSVRRGYLKTDASLMVRDWETEATKEMAQAEPGTDVNALLNSKLAVLMERPEFQDPKVQAAMLPALARAADNVRSTWQKVELKEMFDRQEEGLTEITRQGITDGSLLAPGGLDALYKHLDTEEFAYLNKSDVNDMFAKAAIDVMASGTRDPAEVLAFLNEKRPDGTPGLMNSKWQDQFQAAAQAGNNVITKAQNEARNVTLATMEQGLQGAADRGMLTPTVLEGALRNAGITPESDPAQYTSTMRYFSNQNQATLNKWEAERKAAARHAATLGAIRSGNPYEVGDAKARKAAEKEWAKTPPSGHSALIQKYAALGVVIPQLKAVFTNMVTQTRPQAVALYMGLRGVDPMYAAKYVDESTGAMLYQHHENVTVGGMAEADSLRLMETDAPPKKRAEVQPGITKALTKRLKDEPLLPNGLERPQSYTNLVHRLATDMAIRSPDVPAANVVAAAEEMAATRYTTVGGRYVPRAGMMQGAETATNVALESARNSLVKSGKITEEERGNITVAPNPHDPSKWTLMNQGFPMVDPDDHTRNAVFDPNQLAAAHHKWEAAHASSATQGAAALKRVFKDSFVKPDGTFQELRTNLPKALAAEEEVLRTTPVGTGAHAAQTKRVDGIRKRNDALQAEGQNIPAVSDDFMQYLKDNH